MTEMMNQGDIAFPNLGIYLSQVPKTFEVFGITIAFYGVIIAFGMFLALLLCMKDAKSSGQDPDLYLDFSIYGILFAVIGARIYYVIFAWDTYKDDLLSIFNIRNGGLAIYGGVIGGFLTLYIYTRIKKKSFLQMGDTAVLGLILGQVMGRWGNFMNREAFGEYTNNLFAMALPVDAVRFNEITETMKVNILEGTNYIQVHPTFLYESVWNLCLLGFLLLYKKKKRFQGEIVVLYLGIYGLGRFLVEGLRTDQLLLWSTKLPVSQVLAALLMIFAVGVEIIYTIRNKKGRSLKKSNQDIVS